MFLDSVYFINQLVRAADGGYIPCIATRNQSGFHKTDWNFGSDLAAAEQIAAQKNASAGYSQEEANDIVLSSMRSAEVNHCFNCFIHPLYCGSFEDALRLAFIRADPSNLKLLGKAFPAWAAAWKLFCSH
jgi:hypothetical protein